MPRPRAALLLGVAVLLAGCAGPSQAGDAMDAEGMTTTTETTVTTTTPGDTTERNDTTGTTESPTTTPPTTAIPDDEIVAYEDLSADQQAVFDALLANGSVEGQPDGFHGLSEEIEYVRYEADTYHVVVDGQIGHVGQNRFMAEVVTESEIDADTTVTNVSELDPAAREIIVEAIEADDGSGTYRSSELPESVLDVDVAVRNGTYYRIQQIHGDILIYRIAIEPVADSG